MARPADGTDGTEVPVKRWVRPFCVVCLVVALASFVWVMVTSEYHVLVTVVILTVVASLALLQDSKARRSGRG